MITKTKTKVSFYTLGCRLNQAETAVIENTFDCGDYTIVDFNNPADIVVINTCTVTENGDADTRRLVNKINRINPNSRIALIGCQAQVQKEKLTELKNVRWVVGNANKFDLKSIIKEFDSLDQPHVITPTIPRDSFTIPVAGVDAHHTRANLKVQDGCDFFCTFCEIPYARGRARSRDFQDLIQEANILVDAGHKELVLTGINLGTYKEDGQDIVNVIDALEAIEGLKRIRISSIEPTTIADKLIEKMTNASKLCPYLHIPLQSGSDKVLESMQRKYNTNEFCRFIENAYKTVPNICIGTDVIVGFPDEREEDFEKTFDVLRESPIHYFHVFSYSARNMAKSRNYPDEVDPKTIQKRSKFLRDLSQRKRRVFQENFLNTQMRVLFEQEKDGLWSGLTDNYIRVMVRSSENLENIFKQVRLEAQVGPTVEGSLI